ncbi:Transposase DDE domain-containing protein, partial [Thermosyntropha lipolytica DSM 11003]
EYGKELYQKRGETIERVFADAKEKHGMRYTNLRGLRKVGDYLTLLFACMNLKKLATWKRKQKELPPATPVYGVFLFSNFGFWYILHIISHVKKKTAFRLAPLKAVLSTICEEEILSLPLCFNWL